MTSERDELAALLLRALYSAKTTEESCLRKAALVRTIEADLLSALAAKASGRPALKNRSIRGTVAARRTPKPDDSAKAQRHAQLHKLRKTLWTTAFPPPRSCQHMLARVGGGRAQLILVHFPL
jgi:hypothetical protein